ncbi:MAG TPA: hypothetical protein VN844_25705 [Pyrinomonadaceae bacterium]|nr:hypothetical protein [Pyrinomonadaceae bacterium]
MRRALSLSCALKKTCDRVAGGTGAKAGASGHARFHFANNLTACNGQNAPAHVWFEGVFMRP